MKVSKEKIAIIANLLSRLNTHEKARIVNWLLDDIELEEGVEMPCVELTTFIKKSTLE